MIVKKIFTFFLYFLSFKINFSVTDQISLEDICNPFDFVQSINITESLSSLKNLSEKGNTLLNSSQFSQIEPIFKQIDLKSHQYKEYLFFLNKILKETQKQKIIIDWNLVSLLERNKFIEYNTFLNLNGNNNELNKLFDTLLRKKVDYISKWGWFTDYTIFYDLVGSYSIAKNSRDAGDTRIDNHELIINIEPKYCAPLRKKIPGMKIVLTFVQTYNIFKNNIDNPINEKFKLSDAVLTIPHLLKGTDMIAKIKTDYPEFYKFRNLIKTCLSLNFI